MQFVLGEFKLEDNSSNLVKSLNLKCWANNQVLGRLILKLFQGVIQDHGRIWLREVGGGGGGGRF